MPRQPILKRFDLLVTKDRNPPSDKVQVPAAGTVAFYSQGATVKPGGPIPVPPNTVDPIALPVWHTGAFEIGDDLFLNGDTTKKLHVANVEPEYFTVWVENQGTTTITVSGEPRLVRDQGRPLVYQDPTGQVATGVSTITTVGGRAAGYLRAYRHDFIVTITGTTIRRLYVDGVGSYVMRT